MLSLFVPLQGLFSSAGKKKKREVGGDHKVVAKEEGPFFFYLFFLKKTQLCVGARLPILHKQGEDYTFHFILLPKCWHWSFRACLDPFRPPLFVRLSVWSSPARTENTVDPVADDYSHRSVAVHFDVSRVLLVFREIVSVCFVLFYSFR